MSSGSAQLRVVELPSLSFAEWARLIGDDAAPFGAADELEFRPKDRHVGIRDEHGRLAAVTGVTIATVEVEGHGSFEVVGQGGLIVRRDMRGRGLAAPIMDRIREITLGLGPDRSMLFCEPRLTSLYAPRGYRLLVDPVWIDQPRGPIESPLAAMWRPLRDTADWPRGTVHLHGLPF